MFQAVSSGKLGRKTRLTRKAATSNFNVTCFLTAAKFKPITDHHQTAEFVPSALELLVVMILFVAFGRFFQYWRGSRVRGISDH